MGTYSQHLCPAPCGTVSLKKVSAFEISVKSGLTAVDGMKARARKLKEMHQPK